MTGTDAYLHHFAFSKKKLHNFSQTSMYVHYCLLNLLETCKLEKHRKNKINKEELVKEKWKPVGFYNQPDSRSDRSSTVEGTLNNYAAYRIIPNFKIGSRICPLLLISAASSLVSPCGACWMSFG
jgi:hypothetical protein